MVLFVVEFLDMDVGSDVSVWNAKKGMKYEVSVPVVIMPAVIGAEFSEQVLSLIGEDWEDDFLSWEERGDQI